MAKTKKKAGLAPPGSTLAQNRKALFEYHVLERFEAGISLLGSEVKSIRDAKVSLVESFAQFRGSELYLLGAHVAEYPMAHARNHDPVRPRKLLLHRRELDRLDEAVRMPHLATRGLFADVASAVPGAAPAPLPVAAFRYREAGPELTRPPPRHGEHSAEILADLGCSADEIAALRADGVIA